jgi:ribonuclease P protein component
MTPETPTPPDVRRRSRPTLGREERLRKTSQFAAVYAARGRTADGRLVVYARANGLPQMRLGLSVGARVGGAVARNRIKRLLREAFRQARAVFPGGYDIVIVPVVREFTLEDVDRRLRALVPAAIRRFGEVGRGGGPAERPGGP